MEISSTDELIAYLKKNKDLFSRVYGVTRIGVFGSFASGKSSSSSDIDIVIDMARERKTLQNFMELKRLLERETARKVDLGFESSLKPVVKENIRDQIIYV